MADVNWNRIKNEYINGDISIKKLAEKYNINVNTLEKRKSKEKWGESKRNQYRKITEKVLKKTEEKIAEQESDYIIDISRINFKLAKKIEAMVDKDDDAEFNSRDIKYLTDALKNVRDIQADMPIDDTKTDSEDELSAEELRKLAERNPI